MTKAELKILEKAFMAGLTGTYFQSQPKLAQKLVEEGLLQEFTSDEITCFGKMAIRHLTLTLFGHFIYCDSCAEE